VIGEVDGTAVLSGESPGQASLARRDEYSALMGEISHVVHEGGDWCDVIKAQTLAAMILGLRPSVVCEVGVWMGGSMVPMLLALKAVEAIETRAGAPVRLRLGIAIDAWSADASCAGQDGANLTWWGAQSHDDALATFLARIERHGLESICSVVRARSDDAIVPDSIGLLHLDGNHGEQALRDVERFAPHVIPGGILVLDDLDWVGGHVEMARSRALEMGFRGLFPLGTGVVLQRVT
jgi:cephalosporin hydroxylase